MFLFEGEKSKSRGHATQIEKGKGRIEDFGSSSKRSNTDIEAVLAANKKKHQDSVSAPPSKDFIDHSTIGTKRNPVTSPQSV
mmetsp:Transcript_10272/g.15628  ORF Transcript_10272/g.15628 Transcript_10272/m.15628 type:complete len:82 (+) Transcript_10272:2431-2676(+)